MATTTTAKTSVSRSSPVGGAIGVAGCCNTYIVVVAPVAVASVCLDFVLTLCYIC